MGVLRRRFCVDMTGGKGIYLFLVGLGYDACVGVRQFSSVLLDCGGCVRKIFSLSLAARCWETMLLCLSCIFAFMSAVVSSLGSVGMCVEYRGLLKVVGFISRCEVLCVVFCVVGVMGIVLFCLTCDACNCKCFCMERMLISSCRCCMFVSCVHLVQALRVAFLHDLQFVDAGRGCHRRPYGIV